MTRQGKEDGGTSKKRRKRTVVTGNQSMVVVTLGGRNEGNIKSYTYMQHILVPPRHLCRLIRAWHPMVPVASRKHFILAGLLCCNGNHNLLSEPQSSAVEDLAAKIGREGAAACAGFESREQGSGGDYQGQGVRIRGSGPLDFPLVDDRFQAGFGRRERETGGPVKYLGRLPAAADQATLEGVPVLEQSAQKKHPTWLQLARDWLGVTASPNKLTKNQQRRN